MSSIKYSTYVVAVYQVKTSKLEKGWKVLKKLEQVQLVASSPSDAIKKGKEMIGLRPGYKLEEVGCIEIR